MPHQLVVLPMRRLEVTSSFPASATLAQGQTHYNPVSVVYWRLPAEIETPYARFHLALTTAESVVSNGIANRVTGNFLEFNRAFDAVRDAYEDLK